eukprot:m.78112 g.78112  ORF g.78112 m.78112 type:complete len:473 (-) comp13236_c0_seq3:51-1469(-)
MQKFVLCLLLALSASTPDLDPQPEGTKSQDHDVFKLFEAMDFTPLAEDTLLLSLNFTFVFSNRLKCGSNSRAYGIAPTPLLELACAHNISTFGAHLTQGRWLAAWGAAREPPAGMKIWAHLPTHEHQGLMPRWTAFAQSLALLLSASAGNLVQYTAAPVALPSSEVHMEAVLPEEIACTETLRALRTLHPCTTHSLASLQPTAYLATRFHTLAVDVSPAAVSLTLRAVLANSSSAIQRVLGRPLSCDLACPLAHKTTFRFGELSPVECPAPVTIDSLLASFSSHEHVVENPPITLQRRLQSKVDGQGTVVLDVSNPSSHPALVVITEVYPWMITVLTHTATATLHTLSQQQQQSPSLLALHHFSFSSPSSRQFDLNYSPKQPTTWRYALVLPANTRAVITYHLTAHMLPVSEYHFEPHRGIEAAPARATLCPCVIETRGLGVGVGSDGECAIEIEDEEGEGKGEGEGVRVRA